MCIFGEHSEPRWSGAVSGRSQASTGAHMPPTLSPGLAGLGTWAKRAAIDSVHPVSPIRGELALVILDVDQFHVINERHGWSVGDMVLRSVAAVLRSVLFVCDLCVRIGDDRFAMLLFDVEPVTAASVAWKLHQRLNEVTIPAGHGVDIAISPSIGVACCTALEIERAQLAGMNIDSLVDTVMLAADISRLIAKSTGCGVYVAARLEQL